MIEARTERTQGSNPQLTMDKKLRLAQLVQTQTWQDVLDVMEFAVVRAETRLIQAPHENSTLVMGMHALVQAHWEAFQSLQNEVISAANEILREKEKPREITDQDRVDALLDPTVLLDEEE